MREQPRVFSVTVISKKKKGDVHVKLQNEETKGKTHTKKALLF